MGPEGRGAGQDGAEGGGGARVFLPEPDGSRRGGPSQGLPSAPAGHSPCRVRKSRPESMPDARRLGGAGAARRERGAAGHTRAATAPAASGPSRARRRRAGTAVGGGRGWARDTAPPPPARRCPRPSGPPTRVSPRPVPGAGGRAEAGAGKAASPRPPEGGRAPARNSRLPPASSAAATHSGRPCHYRGRPAPRPARGRLPGLEVMLRGLWRPPREGTASGPTPSPTVEREVRVQASGRCSPRGCCPFCKTGARVPRSSERVPGPCPEEGPLPARWEVSHPGAPLVGAVWGGGGKLTARECRELPFETPQSPPQTPGNLCSRVADRCRAWGRVIVPGSILWMASQEAVWARGPYVDPRHPPSILEPRHPLYRVLREPPGKVWGSCYPSPFGRAPWESWAKCGRAPEGLPG